MLELLWVIALMLVFLGIGAVQTIPWVALMSAGNGLMFKAASVGIPAEAVYFGLLAICLHYNGQVPRGWYWRSFEHHHLLSASQRRLVLPPFFVGAFSFLLIVLGILVVFLAAVSAVIHA